MKEGASIILHLDCLSAVDCLTDEQAGALFKGLLRYVSTGEPLLTPDLALQAVFALFSMDISIFFTVAFDMLFLFVSK